jgi:hypothetical protein
VRAAARLGRRRAEAPPHHPPRRRSDLRLAGTVAEVPAPPSAPPEQAPADQSLTEPPQAATSRRARRVPSRNSEKGEGGGPRRNPGFLRVTRRRAGTGPLRARGAS